MSTSSAPPLSPTTELAQLQRGLDRLRTGETDAAGFTALAQRQQLLAGALPPRFKEVLDPLLNRLEASVLFTDESCSFSRKDLLDSMQLWIDKAALQLQKAALPVQSAQPAESADSSRSKLQP